MSLTNVTKSTCLIMSLMVAMMTSPVALSEPSKQLSDQQKLSYAIGVVFGQRLKHEAGALDMMLFDQGLQDSYHNRTLQLTDAEIKQAFEHYRKAQQNEEQKEQRAFEQRAAENLEKGKIFLSENEAHADVNVLVPGIQYKVLKAGSGKSPSPDDRVTVAYKGYLLNGELFDRSGTPVVFQVNQGPPSWVKVLPRMREGSVWVVWVSPEHGFGSGGAGPVGPNEVLEYHIEMSAVQPAP